MDDDDFDSRTELSPDALALPITLRRHPLTVRWRDRAGAHAERIVATTLLGSGGTAVLRLADPTVSRLHAEIELRDDGAWVRDLGSTNGVFVNTVRVMAARIPPGGSLRLGDLELRCEYETTYQSVDLWPHETFGPLVGRSSPMRDLFARLHRVASSDASVLVQGETGTGKELVARALHECSPRATGPLVVVDCGSLPETLLDAELFGHARGAFTGALSARPGALEAAEGGTVFLDELGELPMAMQPKLLRALESREVRRLGEHAYRPINVRFVSATHRDLQSMVASGAFREDLYFRLAVLPVRLPPLRERREDVPDLLAHFLRRAGAPPGLLDDATVGQLMARPWLGNVRELRNFVDRALALGPREALALDAGTASMDGATMPPRPMPPPTGLPVARAGYPPVDPDRSFKSLRDDWMDHLEREYLRVLMERHQRNFTAVAQAAELDRSYVHRLVKRHGL